MVRRVLKRTRGVFDRIFPERQIYHRSQGEVRYISLSTRQQVMVSAVALAVLLWFVYATASVFLSGHLLSSQSRRAFSNRMHYQRLVAEARAKQASTQALLDSRTRAFAVAADDVDQRLHVLRVLLDAGAANPDTKILDAALSVPSANGQIMMSVLASEQTPRRSRDIAGEGRPGRAQPGAGNAGVTDPLARMASLHDQEDRILQKAEEHAESRIEGLRAVLTMTGLGVDDMMAQDNRNVGGPVVAVDEALAFGDALRLEPDFSRHVTRLAGLLGEEKTMQTLVRDVPLGVPIPVLHRRTSGFGVRVDPITHRTAHHSGQDFGAFRLAPIVATAPGKVIYAGWRTGYGRAVEIDHGFGFKTRYGHMAKLLVKRGQMVRQGQQIGAMGSSGRSTGVHLHYEVWFRGRPYDPQKFLKAGLYVQKG